MDNHKIPQKMLQSVVRDQRQQLEQLQEQRELQNVPEHAERVERSDSIDSDRSSRRTVRIFSASESITSHLIKSDTNFQSIHDAFIIQLIFLSLFCLVRDSYSAGRLYLNVDFFNFGFGSLKQLGQFAGIEVILLLLAMAVHPCLKLWSVIRTKAQYLADITFVSLCVIYSVGGITTTVWLTTYMQFPHLLNFVMGVEQFRLLMKSYSFIRENAYKVLYPWHKDDDSGPAVWYAGQMSPSIGSFGQYFYYLFCPTLLYRDHYPRSNAGIRWSEVFVYLAQFLLMVWVMAFIATNILFPSSLKQGDIIHCYMLCLLMALISMFIGNTAILHAYMNLCAELLCFSDRQFFQNWWTCTSFSSYYRKWNLLVHDWIHAYVYQDLKQVFGKRVAVFTTILVSSIVHEYLLAIGVGFLLPIVTVLFVGAGVFFYVLKPLNNRRASNLLLLACCSLGMSMIIFCFMVEYASRHYCPIKEWSYKAFFLPRTFHCYALHNDFA